MPPPRRPATPCSHSLFPKMAMRRDKQLDQVCYQVPTGAERAGSGRKRAGSE